MTFEEAIIISARKYYKGRDPLELMGSQEKEPKYTREYFVELEKELFDENKDKDIEEELENELD